MADWEKVETVPAWDFRTEFKESKGKPVEFVGLYVSKEEEVGPNNSNLYTFEVNGVYKTIWGNTLLDNRFKNLKVGEEVKVVYLGREESEKRKGAKYHNFEVYHRMPEFKEAEEDVKDESEEDIPFE